MHKELEIILVKKGTLELTVSYETQILKEGDISIIFPNTIHGYKNLTNSEHLIIIFNGDLLPLHKNIFSSYKSVENYLPAQAIPQEVYNCFNSIYEENQSDNNTGIVTGYLYVAVSRLLKLLTLRKINKEVTGDLIERVLGFIQQNYLNPVNLNSIAAYLNISPFHLSRVFSNSLGIRLDRYINELRINYANHLLLSTDKQITGIALDSGFDTLRTFNRAYRNITSITPREFRKQHLR
jgi:AraC-like DNA-binding protein